MNKKLTFEGYSLPDYHRIQLNFSNGVALNYHNWKSCFGRLCKMLNEGAIDFVTFDKCTSIATAYLN